MRAVGALVGAYEEDSTHRDGTGVVSGACAVGVAESCLGVRAGAGVLVAEGAEAGV